MAEHPPVTMTPEQYADMVFCVPFQITPELQAHLLAWSAVITAVAIDLTVQPLSEQRTDGLQALKTANVWVQQAMAMAYGTPIKPSYITIVEEGQQPAPQHNATEQ